MFIKLLRFLFMKKEQNLNTVQITVKHVED